MPFKYFVVSFSLKVYPFFSQYNGTPTKPRLSVFCSDRQLYAMLVDDMNKKCLFYGSTLQKSVRSDPEMNTAVRIT